MYEVSIFRGIYYGCLIIPSGIWWSAYTYKGEHLYRVTNGVFYATPNISLFPDEYEIVTFPSYERKSAFLESDDVIT